MDSVWILSIRDRAWNFAGTDQREILLFSERDLAHLSRSGICPLRQRDRSVRRRNSAAPDLELSGELLPDFVLGAYPKRFLPKRRNTKTDVSMLAGSKFDDPGAEASPWRPPKRLPSVGGEVHHHPIRMEQRELLAAHTDSDALRSGIRDSQHT